MKTLLRRSAFIIFLVSASATLATAQGVGNHFTMFLDSCVQTSGNTIQFDMFIASDGVASSDLRMNATQFGLNFNTAILQSGATITPSYIPLTTDPIFSSATWCFPPSISADHIRATQNPCAGCNSTTSKMTIGQPYRMGRFVLTSSANWMNNASPNFSLQSSIAVGKTVCEALLYYGAIADVRSLYITGTIDSTRSLAIHCSISLLSVNDFTAGLNIHVYPNPSKGLFNITIDKNVKEGLINIYDVLGTKTFSDAFMGREKTINLKLAAGIYFMEIKDTNRTFIQKIIVE